MASQYQIAAALLAFSMCVLAGTDVLIVVGLYLRAYRPHRLESLGGWIMAFSFAEKAAVFVLMAALLLLVEFHYLAAIAALWGLIAAAQQWRNRRTVPAPKRSLPLFANGARAAAHKLVRSSTRWLVRLLAYYVLPFAILFYAGGLPVSWILVLVAIGVVVGPLMGASIWAKCAFADAYVLSLYDTEGLCRAGERLRLQAPAAHIAEPKPPTHRFRMTKDTVIGGLAGLLLGGLVGAIAAAMIQEHYGWSGTTLQVIWGAMTLVSGALGAYIQSKGDRSENVVEGCLFLTDERLIFRTNGADGRHDDWSVPLHAVQGAESYLKVPLSKRLLLGAQHHCFCVTVAGGRRRFMVDDPDGWVKTILQGKLANHAYHCELTDSYPDGSPS